MNVSVCFLNQSNYFKNILLLFNHKLTCPNIIYYVLNQSVKGEKNSTCFHCWAKKIYYLFIYLHGEFNASAWLLRLLLGWKKKHKKVWHIHRQQYLQISNAINYKDTYWWTIINTWTLRNNLPWDNTWKTNHYMTNI